MGCPSRLTCRVLRHSVKLRILPQDTSLRSCRAELLDLGAVTYTISVDNDNVLFLEARLEIITITAGLPAFFYLKRTGKQWF
jgi:hypothetical protein